MNVHENIEISGTMIELEIAGCKVGLMRFIGRV